MNDIDLKKNVAILYIATGRYSVFWEHFYTSAEKYLLTECNKTYFIFTDCTENVLNENNNVIQIYQEKLGWPFDTLLRFEIFLKIREEIQNFDYIFFFNANTEILDTVTIKDILPIEDKFNFVFVHQPHLFHKPKKHFTYDRNPHSLAYIPFDKGDYYFTGALNGGKASAYLDMCDHLAEQIQLDLAKNIIALWHDESYLNRFALDRKDIKKLPPFFTRGETEIWKNKSKIMFSDKTHYRFGGHAYLRGESDQRISEKEWMNANFKIKRRFKFRIKQYAKSLFL